ncbi:MAG: hypothetical protein JWP30_1975 [Homoserinimonas sp.]|jgi:ankyrin repeat protein|nr:hypothetical protein [Homoserinimonas sp.]
MEDNGNLPELSDDELAFVESVFDLARAGQSEQLTTLITSGIPVNLTNAKGDTLLILAAYHQHLAAVEALVQMGADTDRVNDMGQTALACAVFRNSADIVRSLLAAGADPNAGAHTVLQIATQFGLVEMQQLLSEG